MVVELIELGSVGGVGLKSHRGASVLKVTKTALKGGDEQSP